jgi:predicted MFS family arabinose efflux permease
MWYVVLSVTAAQTVISMSNIILATIAPKLAEALGVEPVLIGYQTSLMFGAAMMGSMIGATMALRWGSALTSQAGMGLCAAGMFLFALPHVGYIALGSLAVGASMGLSSPAAAHLLVKYTPAKRSNLMFSIKQTGVPVGGVVTALTAPALAVSVGWQWSLAAIGAFAVVVLLLFERYRKEWDSDRRPGGSTGGESFGGVPLVWREPSLRWVSLVALLFSAIQRCVVTFTVIYLVAEADYGLIEAGVMLSVLQIGGSIARVCWGWLADRIGSSLTVLTVICVITIASSVALMTLGPGWPKPLVYVLFFIVGTAAVGWNGVYHAEAARLSPPGMVSLVAGGTAFYVFAGVLVGPAAFTVAYEIIGTFSATFGLLVVSSVVAFFLLLFARRAASTRPTEQRSPSA